MGRSSMACTIALALDPEGPLSMRALLSVVDCCHLGGVVLWLREGKSWGRRFQGQAAILLTWMSPALRGFIVQRPVDRRVRNFRFP